MEFCTWVVWPFTEALETALPGTGLPLTLNHHTQRACTLLGHSVPVKEGQGWLLLCESRLEKQCVGTTASPTEPALMSTINMPKHLSAEPEIPVEHNHL